MAEAARNGSVRGEPVMARMRVLTTGQFAALHGLDVAIVRSWIARGTLCEKNGLVRAPSEDLIDTVKFARRYKTRRRWPEKTTKHRRAGGGGGVRDIGARSISPEKNGKRRKA